MKAATRRWTEEELARITGQVREAMRAPLERRKYGNTPCVFQGLRFDSQRELKVYRELKLREAAGEIRAVVQQVSFALPGTKRRVRIDFMIVHHDGRIEWQDAKGFLTPTAALKYQQILDAYGIKVKLC